MSAWSPSERSLKRYPHFDAAMTIRQASDLANDPIRVAKHPFLPFIRYRKAWNKFAIKGESGKVKARPIRYAARADAYIYARYRELLSEPYEKLLHDHGLSDSVLAYRRIPAAPPEQGGKCNIHFARDAFSKVRKLGNCFVLALDISDFFESLDHERVKQMWCRALGSARLPEDHFKVFKNITAYAFVDKHALYERLGHIGPKGKTPTGKDIMGYLTAKRDMPIQLCNGAEFRKKIAGPRGSKGIIEKHYKPYGIPQGSPISDLLANLYLFDFDKTVATRCGDLGGFYLRYSDDIFIACPGGEKEALALMDEVRALISQHGERLQIKKEKSSVFVFSAAKDQNQTFKLIHGRQGANGVEYLGFRYDGRKVHLRDSTISNLQRKVARAARYAANSLVRRFADKDVAELEQLFDYEALIERFGRVRNFGEQQREYRNWTFWTYAKKAAAVFGPAGKPILRQLRKHRQNVRARANRAISKAVSSRDKRKGS
jgi:hypothetical protein